MIISFWICLGLICWSYFFYPLVIILIAKLLPGKKFKTPQASDSSLPPVTVIIAAYNEEDDIAKRIGNLLEQDYPKDKLGIIVASDGSSDRTVEAARTVAGDKVQVLDYHERRGKANVLNEIVPSVNSPIVAFSDANTEWKSDALGILVRGLENPRVGIVTGQLRILHQKQHEVVSQETVYIDMENLLRMSESRMGNALGAFGSIYCLRKEQFVPFPPNTAVDDFYEAMMLAGKGLRTLYLPQAKAYEFTAPNPQGEFRRRIRIGAGNFQNMFRLARFLLPDKGFLALAFLSHKVIRWLGPFLLILIWLSTAYLSLSDSALFWQLCFWLQTTWHILALAGWGILCCGFSLFKFLFIPYYFDLINLALFLGFIRFITGTQKAVWRKGR